MPLMKTLKLGNTTYTIPISGGGSGMSAEAVAALLDCFEHVAWVDDDGQDYYDALYEALTSEDPTPSATVTSISAVFTQGNNVVYDTDSLDTLKQYLTVTANYSDSTTQTVTNYTLSGTLTAGTSTITVLYGGKTTTFSVVVSLDTAARIAENNKIMVYSSYPQPEMYLRDKTNGCVTIKYDMLQPSTVLNPVGIIPTDGTTVIAADEAAIGIFDNNNAHVNHVSEYNRWAQNQSGTLTEYSQRWDLGSNEYTKISFTLDMRYLDRAYMYDGTTGQIWFAGENTPYYGMSNISEASA